MFSGHIVSKCKLNVKTMPWLLFLFVGGGGKKIFTSEPQLIFIQQAWPLKVHFIKTSPVLLPLD